MGKYINAVGRITIVKPKKKKNYFMYALFACLMLLFTIHSAISVSLPLEHIYQVGTLTDGAPVMDVMIDGDYLITSSQNFSKVEGQWLEIYRMTDQLHIYHSLSATRASYNPIRPYVSLTMSPSKILFQCYQPVSGSLDLVIEPYDVSNYAAITAYDAPAYDFGVVSSGVYCKVSAEIGNAIYLLVTAGDATPIGLTYYKANHTMSSNYTSFDNGSYYLHQPMLRADNTNFYVASGKNFYNVFGISTSVVTSNVNFSQGGQDYFSDGKYTNASNYSNVIQSSNGCGSDFHPFAIYNLANIIGANSTNFLRCDVRDLINPVVIPYDNAPINLNISGGDTKRVALIKGSEVYVYNYLSVVGAAANCSAGMGCYLNDTFSYDDSVLNHGWGGWDVLPRPLQVGNNGLVCNSTNQYNFYNIVPLTSSTGTVKLEFKASVCSGGGGELYYSLGNGGTTAVAVTIRDNGNIVDTRGIVIGTLNTSNCSSYQRDYKITTFFFMQNQPRTYSLYVNNTLQSANVQFTQEGNVMPQLSWFFLGGGLVPNYCNWSVDDISLSATLADSASLNASANRWGDLILSGENAGFDRSVCRPDEDLNWCFLRSLFTNIGNFMLNIIVEHTLVFIALIILLAIFIILKRASG